jgi:oligosaccharide reducing-end xylanase
MNKPLISALAGAMMIASAASAQLPQGYEVATWHGFSDCAVTYSFDDLTGNQLPVAIPIFDKYNLKATLNVVTDWVSASQWATLKSVSTSGHEVASHTVAHKNMTELSAEDFESEMSESKKKIESAVGKECITMVYPYCAKAHEEITSKYYISARSCSGQVENQTPVNMYDISSKGVGTESATQTADDFNAWVADGVKLGGWCTFLIHGIDDDKGYSPIKSNELEKHLQYVAGHPHKFWVATFASVTKYIIERNSLVVSEIQKGKSAKVTVECKAKSSLTKFDEPITLRRIAPEGCQQVILKAPGVKTKKEVNNGRVVFDVVPGNTYMLIFK